MPSWHDARPQPDIGPALAAAGFADAAFEGVEGAFGVGRGGLGLAEHVAQVEEMLLASAPLGKIGSLPLGDEFLRSHTLAPRDNIAERVLVPQILAGPMRKFQ